MEGSHQPRDLGRLKWIGVVLPVAFVWLFELARFSVLEPAYGNDSAHLVAATLMAVAVVVFALLMGTFLERAQRQIVGQNRDLMLTHGVSAAARERLALPETLADTLDQVVARTGALAGIVVVDGPEGLPLVMRRPEALPSGLDWVDALLDEELAPLPLGPTWSERRAIDSGLLDLPLRRGGDRLGRIRLVFHPPVRPDVSPAALADIAGEIATAVELGRVVSDLRRREHERAALYEVALQLTGRADVRETLDTITRFARELLASDRAVVCLAEPVAATSRAPAWGQRLALADDGSATTFAHASARGAHVRNPECQVVADVPPSQFISLPLRGPDGVLGEMCVVRVEGPTFTPVDRSLLGALADMAAIAVRTARLHEAEQQFTILAERDRIARELHDSLAQVLGVIHLRLRALEPSVAGVHPPEVVHELSDLADLADEAYRDVREAILGLRETISAEAGLEGTIRDYLAKYARQTGIRASLVCHGNPRGVFEPRAEVQLLRVVQEALTNVRKHAGASHVVVQLDCAGDSPVVTIEDDGAGFDPATAVASLDGGFGMTSMRERVDQIGGTMEVDTARGRGTRIVIRLEEKGTSDTAAATAHPAR